jgi:hypothetical protein
VKSRESRQRDTLYSSRRSSRYGAASGSDLPSRHPLIDQKVARHLKPSADGYRNECCDLREGRSATARCTVPGAPPAGVERIQRPALTATSQDPPPTPLLDRSAPVIRRA